MRVKKKNIATTTLSVNIQSVCCLPSTTTFTLKSCLLKKKITEQLIYFHVFELVCLNPFLLRYAHLRTAPTCMHTKAKARVDWHKHETDLHLCLCFVFLWEKRFRSHLPRPHPAVRRSHQVSTAESQTFIMLFFQYLSCWGHACTQDQIKMSRMLWKYKLDVGFFSSSKCVSVKKKKKKRLLDKLDPSCLHPPY